MKTINRYIIWELLQSFLFAFIAMTVLLIIIGLVQKAMEHNIPLLQTLYLVPFVMVEMSRISIPVTFLLAVTTFFAKMSGNNEVIALKSLGIAPWMYLWPVMLLGILVSLLSVWLNETAITWGRSGAASVIYNAAEDIILNQLRINHRFMSEAGDLKIMVRGVENRRLISPTITLNNPPMVIEARYAQIKIDFSNQELTVILNQPKVDADEKASYIGEERTIKFPLERIIKADTEEKRASDMGLSEIPVKVESLQTAMLESQRRMAAQRAFSTGIGSIAFWNNAGATERAEQNRKDMERLQVEPPRRWATGFSCLFFIWLGAPLAIWMKKSDIFSSFFACFCPILLLYYPLLMFGMQGAKHGTMPSGAVWIANICLGVIGFWFLKKIHRY